MKKVFSLLLVFVLLFSLCACGSNTDNGAPTKIRFSQSLEELKALDGKKVEINGFMSMLSPLNGELIYLMNIPMQSCPCCVPNTTTLSNTIAVKGKNIEYTSKPVKITGTINFDNYTDDYGYNYEYRINDATITVLDETELSEKMKIYYTLTENDYLGEIYNVCSFIDQVAYHNDYEIPVEEIINYGEIPFDKYQEILDSITSINKNGEYDEFIALLNKTETTRQDVNKVILAKESDKFESFQTVSGELYEMFTAFINKYEF